MPFQMVWHQQISIVIYNSSYIILEKIRVILDVCYSLRLKFIVICIIFPVIFRIWIFVFLIFSYSLLKKRKCTKCILSVLLSISKLVEPIWNYDSWWVFNKSLACCITSRLNFMAVMNGSWRRMLFSSSWNFLNFNWMSWPVVWRSTNFDSDDATDEIVTSISSLFFCEPLDRCFFFSTDEVTELTFVGVVFSKFPWNNFQKHKLTLN